MNLCIAKAAIEITRGPKMKLVQIHQEMSEKYHRWAKLISDKEIGITNTPTYVTFPMLMTMARKPMNQTHANGKKLWEKWLLIKRNIINSTNITINKVIQGMPGKALPSGSDFKYFLDMLIMELFRIKSKKGNDLVDEEINEDIMECEAIEKNYSTEANEEEGEKFLKKKWMVSMLKSLKDLYHPIF